MLVNTHGKLHKNVALDQNDNNMEEHVKYINEVYVYNMSSMFTTTKLSYWNVEVHLISEDMYLLPQA